MFRGQGGRAADDVRGLQRVGREHVLDVGQDQFLMLLLVVQSQFQQGVEVRVVAAQARDQIVHGAVHVLAIVQHVGKRRAR